MKASSKLAAGLSFICMSASLQAGTMGQADSTWQEWPRPRAVVEKNPWRGMMSLGVGPAWVSGGETQTFYLQSDIAKTYAADKNTQTLVGGEVFLGAYHNVGSWQTQLGVAVAFASNLTLSGDIWEDADPDFNNYTYQYNIQHARAVIKGKLLKRCIHDWLPYISAGVGLGVNRSSAFEITPKIFEEVPAPPFTSDTKTTFSYSLGIGVQRAFRTHWQAGIGYEFADWGKSGLGRAPGQTLNSGLQLDNLYAQQLLFTLSYLA